MKKQFYWIIALFFAINFVFITLGCKNLESPFLSDVTDLTAINKDSSVLLTWVDIIDENIYGYEVTWNPSTPINRSESMTENSIMIAPNSNGCYIGNLINGTKYTFTVKTIDLKGNKSLGVSTSITPTVIEKPALKIELTPSTTKKTNKDVVISVNAITDDASKIKKITYVKGFVAKIDTVLQGKDITDTKEIVAIENVDYTVAVTDTAGRRELSFITIDNIDKTALVPVANLVAGYSGKSEKITISWINPTDADFEGTLVSYFKSAIEPVHIHNEVSKNVTSFEIPDIVADDSGYVIYLRPKDDVGNIGEASIITLLASPEPVVTSISIDKTHFDSIMTNRDISVNITGYNFDKLTNLYLYILDGTAGAGKIKVEDINTNDNTATAKITAPIPNNPTDEGKSYTVVAEINGKDYSDASASFVVSKPACVTEIVLDQKEITSSISDKVTATIIGKNFDIRGETKVAFFDSNDNEITSKTVIVPLANNISANEFTVELSVPTEKEDTYKLVVFFDDVKYETSTTIKVYPKPIINKIEIPAAGISYKGQNIPVTIFGKNFTVPGVTESYFTSDVVTNFSIINDVMLVGEVVCPFDVGETEVEVYSGSTSATGTIKVIAQEKCFAPGDIILSDGSRVSVNDVDSYTINNANKPIGVIASAPYGGAVGKAIGLKSSDTKLGFTGSSSSQGCKTSFKELILKYTQNYGRFTFKGDLDGSDNWDYICSIDPNGTANPEVNYPAFNFAINYGTKADITGNYATGWYLPTAADLYDLGMNNRDVVQKSLDKAGGFNYLDIDKDVNGNEIPCSYLSSSQSDYGNDFVLHVNTRGSVSYYFKNFSYRVIVFHDFTAE